MDEHYHYYPIGVPVTPQAKSMGYSTDVYVSHSIWQNQCTWKGPEKFKTHLDRRILEVLHSCFIGMGKRLAVNDDAVGFTFKHWYWPNDISPTAKKQLQTKLGARLFMYPDTNTPWLLIYTLNFDTLDHLIKGDAPNESNTSDFSDTDNRRTSPRIRNE